MALALHLADLWGVLLSFKTICGGFAYFCELKKLHNVDPKPNAFTDFEYGQCVFSFRTLMMVNLFFFNVLA